MKIFKKISVLSFVLSLLFLLTACVPDDAVTDSTSAQSVEQQTEAESISNSSSETENESESETVDENSNVIEKVVDGIKHVIIKHPVLSHTEEEDKNGYIEVVFAVNDLPSTIRIVTLNADGELICAELTMKNLVDVNLRFYTYYQQNQRKFAVAVENLTKGAENGIVTSYIASIELPLHTSPSEKPYLFTALVHHYTEVKKYASLIDEDYVKDNQEFYDFYRLLDFDGYLKKTLGNANYHADMIFSYENGQLNTEMQENINGYPSLPLYISEKMGFVDLANENLNLGFPKHEAGEWTVTKEPACNSNGLRESICTHCGIKMIETIEISAHSFENSVCTVCGLDERACLDFIFQSKGKHMVISNRDSAAEFPDEEVIFPTVYMGLPVTEIHYALSGIPHVKRVIIPEGYLALDNYAFQGCSALESVSIPKTVTKIGDKVFSGCINLKNIELPDGLTSIGTGAFSGTGIESIKIPDGVLTIGRGALSGCDSLTEVTVPAGVQSAVGLFQNCEGLKTVIFEGADTTIESFCFTKCTALKSVTLPSALKALDSNTFMDCLSLESITLPESLERIGTRAFSGCWNLTEIVIPEKVTKIDTLAFEKCTNLTTLTLPKGITYIGNGAFSDCWSLSVINFGGTMEEWESFATDSLTSQFAKGYTVHCSDGDIVDTAQ